MKKTVWYYRLKVLILSLVSWIVGALICAAFASGNPRIVGGLCIVGLAYLLTYALTTRSHTMQMENSLNHLHCGAAASCGLLMGIGFAAGGHPLVVAFVAMIGLAAVIGQCLTAFTLYKGVYIGTSVEYLRRQWRKRR